MATPLGWHFWSEIAGSLSRIRQLGIDEWARPRLTNPTLLPFWVTVAALVGSAIGRGQALLRSPDTRRSGFVTLCACAFVLLPAALTAVRNVPPFLMVAVPAVAALWASPVIQNNPRRVAPRPMLNVAIAALALVVAAMSVTLAYATGLPRLNWTPLPAASLAALDGCEGNLYNRYDEGGYLIWFAPRHKVFLDGRQDPYPPALIRAQFDAETSGDVGGLFERFAIRCAYVPAASRVSGRLARDGWKTLYRDEAWAVLARHDP
jgi:hypothetical protein